MLRDYELKQNNNLRKNKKWCRGSKEQLKQLGNLTNRKSYGRRAAKLRFLCLAIPRLDRPVGSVLSHCPVGCGNARACFGESVAGLGTDSCPSHHFSSNIFCGACFFLCFVVWHLSPSPIQQHYAGGDPLLVPLLSAGSATGISRLKE